MSFMDVLRALTGTGNYFAAPQQVRAAAGPGGAPVSVIPAALGTPGDAYASGYGNAQPQQPNMLSSILLGAAADPHFSLKKAMQIDAGISGLKHTFDRAPASTAAPAPAAQPAAAPAQYDPQGLPGNPSDNSVPAPAQNLLAMGSPQDAYQGGYGNAQPSAQPAALAALGTPGDAYQSGYGNAQPSPLAALAGQFGNSQQLANADPSKGILPTLLAATSTAGQPVATPQGYVPPATGGAWGGGTTGSTAPAAAAQPSLFQRWENFTQSPRGQALADMFAGWAMGKTPQQSLGYGASLMHINGTTRQQQNATVQWLTGQGMDKNEATMLARNPTLLNTTLQMMMQKPVAVAPGTTLVDPRTGKVVAQTPQNPSFGAIGQDEYGNTTYGWRNPATGAVTPASAVGGSAQGAGATAYKPDQVAQLHGPDFLATLPPALSQQVKAYAEGRMPMPTGFALKSPYFQKMMQMVTQYDPSFDAVNYGARYKTRSDFTSGKSAQSINALNTVIGHLQTLAQAGDALGNTNYPVWNAAKNVYENATGDPRIKDFDTTKKAVVDELTRVWRGTGGSEGDIKTWAGQIDAANSPSQLHSVIAKIGDLLESKLSALGETYAQGMGTTENPMQFVTPKAKAALEQMRSYGQKAAAPKVGEIQDGYRFKGGDPADQNNWERAQ